MPFFVFGLKTLALTENAKISLSHSAKKPSFVLSTVFALRV